MAHVCFFPALCFYSQSTFIRPLITNVKLTEVKHVSFKTDQAKRAAQMTTNITLTVSIKVFEWLKKTGSTVNQNHEDTYKTSNIFILYKTLSEVINIRYLKYTKNTQNRHKSLLSTTPRSRCPFKYFSFSLFTLVLSVSHSSISRPWHREAMLLCCVIVWKHDTDPTPRGPAEASCRITEALRICRSSQSDAFVFWWFTFATTLKK